MRIFWFICGWLSFFVGLIGAYLPFIPTIPLMILAAFCFARSSERFHLWLVSHPIFGPPIHDWQKRGAISIRGKKYATLSVIITFGISIALELPIYALFLQAFILSLVMLFIWTRPSD